MSKYSDETKAAVLAALLAGQSITEVAREYKIPKGTVSSWKSRELGDVSQTIATQKREALGDLLLDYLQETFTTLIAQARFARTKEWLEKQTGSEFAVLHGVQTDKAIRLLEALSASNDTTPEDQDGAV